MLQPRDPCLGRYRSTLPDDAELAIAGCIKDMQKKKRMVGLTCKDVRKVAFSIADRQNFTPPINKETNITGKNWMNSFMKRNN